MPPPLKAIPSMHLKFSELVDIPTVQAMMESLWAATGLPLAIRDVDGQVLVGTGCQEICTRFHCRHPEARRSCDRRDLYVREVLAKREPSRQGESITYRCSNGLTVIALPILIRERHLATLFLGQFLFEPPLADDFAERSRRFDFPLEPYLAALARVPIFSEAKVEEILSFHRHLLHFLTRMGAEKLRRMAAQEELARREQLLGRQNQALLHLGMLRALDQGSLSDVVREVLETAGRTLEVERTSFWRFSPDRRQLHCSWLYRRETDSHFDDRGVEIEVARYPGYFQAIDGMRNVATHDVATDPRTSALLEEYLRPAGITSILDTPVWSGGRMVGILCCEHVGPPRVWTYEEQNFAGSMADILSLVLEGSERRQAEAALRESEEKYRLLFSAESDAILIIDAESKNFLEVNVAATLLYGYGKDEFASLNIRDLVTEPEKAAERMAEVLAGVRTRVPLAYHRKRDGTVFPVEISSGTFLWKGRRRLVAIIHDITERQQIMRMKDELLSTVSHEIRTPLTAILGFADFLRSNPVEPEQQKEFLDIICSEGERLKELTDNLLDLQRWRAGFGTEVFAPVPLQPLLQSVWLLFRQDSPRHRLVLDCEANLPPIFGEEGQLYRALQNLISNAIKFSPLGGVISIGAKREGEFAHLWVKDEGIGIPENAREQIFDRFFRVDEAKEWIGGTGLGLALVKAVAQGHKGRVWVESERGRGSTFFLALPLLSTWDKRPKEP